jgi:pimeloyl-ACP methyl ester carboxylesterase
MNIIKKSIFNKGAEIVYWGSNINADNWIVLLHGAGVDHNMFARQLEILYGKFNLLLWDARAQGESHYTGKEFSFELLCSDLLKILQQENCNKAVFIGQSLGGNLAQEITFHHPELVSSLILIDCTCNTGKLTIYEKFLLKISPFLLTIYPWQMLVKQSAVACSVKKEVQDYIVGCFRKTGKRNFIKIMTAGIECLHEEPGYTINKPLLLICGEYDLTGNIKKTALTWKDTEPGCEFHLIKDAGHNANQDNPQMVNDLIAKFLEAVFHLSSN